MRARTETPLEESRLLGLRLVHVSPEPPSAALLAACAKRSAVCSHRRWSEMQSESK